MPDVESIIASDRIVLREFVEDDWEGVHEYASDERVVYYLDWGPNTPEESRAFVNRGIACQREIPRRYYDMAIMERETGEFIGCGAIRITYPFYGEGEIHCVIVRKHWGRGFATETAQLLQEFGFEHLKLHRVFGVVDPANVPTARVFEKTGFVREGHLREHKWIKGIWRDSLIYAMLEDEWAAQTGKACPIPNRA